MLVGERTHAATVDAIAYAQPTAHALRGQREPVVAYPAVRVRHRPGERVARGCHARRCSAATRSWRSSSRRSTTAAAAGTPVAGRRGGGGRASASPGWSTSWTPTLRRLGVGRHGGQRSACAPYGDHGPLAPLAAVVRVVLGGARRGSPDGEQRSAALAGLERLAPRGRRRTAATWPTARCSCSGWASCRGATRCRTSPLRSRLSEELRRGREGGGGGGRRSSGRSSPWWTTPTSPIPSVLDALDRLGGDGRGSLLVVRRRPRGAPRACARRSADREPAPAASSASGRSDDGASHELLHRTLAQLDGHTGTLAATAEQQILRAAGGNPLLLDQLVRFLRETGALEVVEGGWRAARDLDEVGLPG